MSARAQRLADLLPEAGVDLMLVTELVNVRYLTGFTGTNGVALVGPQTREFLTDFRYVEQAAEEVDGTFERRRSSQNLLDAIEEVLPAVGLRVGFEDASMSVRQHARLSEQLGDRAELVAVGTLVERLRAVKEPEEIARIAAASELADAAFERVVGEGLIGRTEREVADALELEMRRAGARRPSFETIVATGAHGALPHAQPREVAIRAGELVVIDWGAELEGYCSDCTRTVAAGETSRRAREVYALVLEAQISGLHAVRPEVGGEQADGAAREVIEAAGHGEHFGHGLGHGVGIDVHEAPRLSQRSEDVLRAGNVVTVEPGIYLPGELGVRIEDLVVVREDGGQIITGVAKELRITR